MNIFVHFAHFNIISCRKNGNRCICSKYSVPALFIFCSSGSEHPPYSYDIGIGSAADSDPVRLVHCVDDCSVSHVQTHMSVIENQISRLGFFVAYSIPGIHHIICCSRKADPEMCIYRLNEAGTVSSFCQARTAPDVWISYELTGIIDHCLSGYRSTAARCAASPAAG